MNKMNEHSNHIDGNQSSNINLVFKSQLTNDKELRVFGTSLDPWFVGKDIAEFLGYIDTKKALQDHVDDEDKMTLDQFRKRREVIHLPSFLHPHTILINESGLYSLIMRSKLEKAKPFKRWVTSDVLPSIRKTGQYNISTLSTISSTQLPPLPAPVDLYMVEAEELRKNVDRTICAETPSMYLFYVGKYLKLGFSKDAFPIRAPVHQKDEEFPVCVLVALWNASQVVEQKIHNQLKEFRAVDTKKLEVYVIQSTIANFIALVDKYIDIFTKDDKLLEEHKELTHKYELIVLSKQLSDLKKDNEISLLKKDIEILQLKQSLATKQQTQVSQTSAQTSASRMCKTCNIMQDLTQFHTRMDGCTNHVCKKCTHHKQSEREKVRRALARQQNQNHNH
jgi:prophage antirepressor-like protein